MENVILIRTKFMMKLVRNQEFCTLLQEMLMVDRLIVCLLFNVQRQTVLAFLEREQINNLYNRLVL